MSEDSRAELEQVCYIAQLLNLGERFRNASTPPDAARAHRRELDRLWRLKNADRVREKNRRWRQKDPEHTRQLAREGAHRYRAKTPEKVTAYQKSYRTRNRERLNAISREYAASHRAEARARAKAWYQLHLSAEFREAERLRLRALYASSPEVRAAKARWRDRNREKHRQYLRASQAKRRAASGGYSACAWNQLVERYSGCCAYCGASGALHADHRTPLSRGGPNVIENILPACRRCNLRKGRLTEDEFRDRLAKEAAAGRSSPASAYTPSGRARAPGIPPRA